MTSRSPRRTEIISSAEGHAAPEHRPEEPEYERAELVPPGVYATTTRHALERAREMLASLAHHEPGDEQIRACLAEAAASSGVNMAQLEWILCVALTGQCDCPSAAQAVEAMGKEAAVRYISRAILELKTVA